MTLKSSRRRSGLGLRKLTSGSPRRGSPVKRRRSLIGAGAGAGASIDGSSEASPSATNIKVSVRVRPPNDRELTSEEDAFRALIEVVDDKLLIFDPKVQDGNFYFHGKVQRRRDLNKRPQKDHKFTFDRVFGPEENNETVFENTTLELVDALFAGYNSSVFVYGATGAGKTFTMLGNEENPGITYRTVKAIYERIESTADELSCEVSISYLEIYNENVVDLINPGNVQLVIREDGQNGVNIPGLTRHKPKTPDELLKLLRHGNSNRSQHPTDANAESSRSHAVFQVFLTQKDRSSGLSADVKVAKLSMIDLAGSERGTVTSSRGAARKKEGANINKSLLALGNCINALAEGSKYIPFRNSKLTRLLKDSLGGNCRTVMISNVSPSNKTYEDTYNTLKYAERAKKIKVKLKKNVMSVDFHVAQYAKIVENLKQEISELKEKLKLSESRIEEGINVEDDEEFKSLMEENTALKNENSILKKKVEESDKKGLDLTSGAAFQEAKMVFKNKLELESQIKLSYVKMSHCQTIIDRTKMISRLFGHSEVSVANKNCLKTMKGLENMVADLKVQKAKADEKYMETKNKLDVDTSSLQLKQEYTAKLKALENQMVNQHLYKFAHLIASERRKDNYLIGLFLPNLIASNLELNGLDGSNNDKIQNIVDYFSGKKVLWDEDLIESSNLDSNDQLMGRIYADNVSISDALCQSLPEHREDLNMECEIIETKEPKSNLSETTEYDFDSQRLPAPQEKEKHTKVLAPTSVFDMSLDEESPSQEATVSSNIEAAKSTPNDNGIVPDACNEVSEMNSTQVISSPELCSQPSLDSTVVLKPSFETDLNSTQTIHASSETQGVESSLPDLNSTHTVEPSPPCSIDLNTTHTIDLPSPLHKDHPDKSKKAHLTLPHTTFNLPKVPSSDETSRNVRRETYSLLKPTVAVQPISQSFKAEKISPRVILAKNTHGRPVSRTPPAMGTAEPRRKLNSSKSTSRLLTSADLRLGPSNGQTFRRPQPVSSASSAPSYMASTTASSNKLNKQKENLKPTTSESAKASIMRQLKRTFPKKS